MLFILFNSLFLGCGDSINEDNKEAEDNSMFCDENPSLNLVEEDADCDLVVTSEDCDDNDASITNTNVDDADCDGVLTAEDCDDNDALITNTNVDDADCDLVVNIPILFSTYALLRRVSSAHACLYRSIFLCLILRHLT